MNTKRNRRPARRRAVVLRRPELEPMESRCLLAAAATVTTLTVDPLLMTAGAKATLRAEVDATAVPTTPVGAVTFTIDGVPARTVPLVHGSASYVATMSRANAHEVVASFVPTDPAAFAPSTSDPATAQAVSLREYALSGRLGLPVGIAIDPESPTGDVYVTQAGRNAIAQYRFDVPSLTYVQEFTIPTANALPANIVARSSPQPELAAGAMAPPVEEVGTEFFFTEPGINKIGRMTAAGAFTQYALPTADALPFGIAADAAGNIWFTELAADRVGVIRTDGMLTEYTLPSEVSGPAGIVYNDSSDAICVTAVGSSDVVVFDPDRPGDMQVFPTLTEDAGPFGILYNSSDDLTWFTELGVGKIASLDPGTGTVLEYDLPAANSVPAGIAVLSGRTLAVTEATGNKIAIFDANTFQVMEEVPVPTALAFPLTAVGTEGFGFFTEPVGNQVGVLAPIQAGATIAAQAATYRVTEYALPGKAGAPFAAAVGADGTVWMTEASGNAVVRVEPGTQATKAIPVPTAGARPLGVTIAPDGTVWVAEGIGKLARIDPATNAITEISPEGVGGTGVVGVAADPSGRIWFTQSMANAVGIYDPATGQTTGVDLPHADSGPLGIVYGNDGKMYVTELTGGRIAAIATDTRAVTEIPLPDENSGPAMIAVGADGDLWFSETIGAAIGRLRAGDRQLEEFDVPGTLTIPWGVQPVGGQLWFTELLGGRVGMLDEASGAVGAVDLSGAQPGPAGIVADTPASLLYTAFVGGGYGRVLTESQPAIPTTVTLTAAPNPSTFGQAVTVRIVVAPGVMPEAARGRVGPRQADGAAPTGMVTLTLDGKALPAVRLTPSTSGETATATVRLPLAGAPPLAVGRHTLTASYAGDEAFGASTTAAPTTLVVNPAEAGPRVLGVARLGYHMQPTRLVIRFSGPLDRASAEDLANYRLTVGNAKQALRIDSAVYDPVAQTVTLRPHRLLPLAYRYRLTVVGQPPAGVAGADGTPLDGRGDGHNGTDYTTTITRQNLVMPVVTRPTATPPKAPARPVVAPARAPGRVAAVPQGPTRLLRR